MILLHAQTLYLPALTFFHLCLQSLDVSEHVSVQSGLYNWIRLGFCVSMFKHVAAITYMPSICIL